MSDTPRVDAFVKEQETWRDVHWVNFAQELERELGAAKAQLPAEMQDCTIVFKECEKGHGWLTATNWVQHGCPTCAADELRESLCYAIQEADGWYYECCGKEGVGGPEMDKARSLATATPTPPPLSPPTPATVPAEPGSTPPADR